MPDWLPEPLDCDPDEPEDPDEPLELPAPDGLPEEPVPLGLELLPLELPVPPPAALLPPLCPVRGWFCLFESGGHPASEPTRSPAPTIAIHLRMDLPSIRQG